MQNVVVKLDAVKKRTNKSEYHTVCRATCDEFGLVVVGYGKIVRQIARDLAEKNCDISRGFEVRRGDTVCFDIVPLNAWVNPPNRMPEHLREV